MFVDIDCAPFGPCFSRGFPGLHTATSRINIDMSSSMEPLSTGSDDLRQRSALEKAPPVESSSSESTMCSITDEKLEGEETSIEQKHLLELQQLEEHHKAKHVANLLAMKRSEVLNRTTVQMSILFYVSIYILANYINPEFKKFYTLSYKYEGTQVYDIGLDDIYFFVFWIINLMFCRSFLIIYVFKPCAKMLHIRSFKGIQRFIEQSWSIFYYSLSWGFGFYLYYKSDYFFNCYNIYANWPHDKLSAEFKFYYLVQTANWFQQFIVIFLEAKRKDHIQMVSHHIITIMLCTGSYACYLTRIGHIILLLMDIVDVFLSTAKILKYCKFQTVCDVMFIMFMFVWIVLRHGVYNYVLYFSWTKAREIMDMDCSKFAPGEYVKLCYTDLQIDILLILLAFLQVIMCIWMYMILRVAIRVVTGGSADDVRSDSED